MALLLFLLLCYSIKSNEVCEKFLIVHNMSNCEVVEAEILRRINPPLACPNQGTWSCEQFICIAPVEENATCLFGYIDHLECCHQKNIHYIDFWITPLDVWGLYFFNFFMVGVENETLILNDEHYEDIFDFVNNETFVSIVLEYGEDCLTNISIYINGNLSVVNYYEMEIYDISGYVYQILSFLETDVLVHFISAHTIVPTADEILWLFGLGKNRSVDTELCYGCPCNLFYCTDSGYRTATIVLSIALGIILLLGLLAILMRLIRYFSNNPDMQTYGKMKDDEIELGENVFF